jgi:hypothetical protein
MLSGGIGAAAIATPGIGLPFYSCYGNRTNQSAKKRQ